MRTLRVVELDQELAVVRSMVTFDPKTAAVMWCEACDRAARGEIEGCALFADGVLQEAVNPVIREVLLQDEPAAQVAVWEEVARCL